MPQDRDLVVDITAAARHNVAFRRELLTGPNAQVVLMNLPPGVEIGREVHNDVDQVLVIVDGTGEAELNGRASPLGTGDLVFVPSGTEHNIRNTAEHDLRLYTVYAPPEHSARTVHATREEADAAHH